MRTLPLLLRATAVAAVAGLGLLNVPASPAALASPALARGPIVLSVPIAESSPLGRTIAPVPVSAGDSNPGQTLTFSATGLPPGLSISSTGAMTAAITGALPGAITDAASYPVTVTATDSTGASGSASFTWDLHGTISVPQMPQQWVQIGAPVHLQIPAADPVPGQTLTFSLDFIDDTLPPGLSMTSGGLVTGSILRLPPGFSNDIGYWNEAVTVSDGLGAEASAVLGFAAFIGPGLSAPGEMTSAIRGRCMDDAGNGSANGNRVVLWKCNGSAAQQWQAFQDSSLEIHGKCLSAAGGRTKNGTPVVLGTCQDRIPADSWFYSSNGQVQNWLGRCLQDPGAKTRNGTVLELRTCDNTPRAAQRWSLPTGAITSGVRGMCVNDSKGSTASGTAITASRCNGSAAQRWAAWPDETIRFGGKCLGLLGAHTVNGTKAQLRPCKVGDFSESWSITANGEIINTSSSECLEDPGASTASGTRLQAGTCEGQPGQSWRVI